MTPPAGVIPAVAAPVRALRTIGTAGAALALVILAASILLRLTTGFGAESQPISALPSAAEGAIRLVHRVAASGAGLLALWAVILCWTKRRFVAGALGPTAWIATATVMLAVIGPLTPGYRFLAVTVANVVGGMVLLMAFWWLRESLAAAPPSRRSSDPLLTIAFVAYLAHAGSGAAASALEIRGIRWVAFVHLGTAMLATMFVGAILWELRGRHALGRIVRSMAFLLAMQLVFGLATLWIDHRPVWMSFIHAMLALFFAVGLVSIAVRDPDRDPNSRAFGQECKG